MYFNYIIYFFIDKKLDSTMLEVVVAEACKDLVNEECNNLNAKKNGSSRRI